MNERMYAKKAKNESQKFNNKDVIIGILPLYFKGSLREMKRYLRIVIFITIKPLNLCYHPVVD